MQNGRKSTENGHLPEARENAGGQRPIALKFAPDWLKSWRHFQGQSQSTLRQENIILYLIVICCECFVYLLDPELEGVRLSDGWPSGLLAFPFAATTVKSSEVNVNREVLFTKEKREIINKMLNSERSFDIIWYDFSVLSGKRFSRLYICHVFHTLRDKLSRKQWEITLAYSRYRGFRYPGKHNPLERRKAQKWKRMTLVAKRWLPSFPTKITCPARLFFSPIQRSFMTQFVKEGLTFSLVIFAAFLSRIRNLICPSKFLSLFLLLQTMKQGFHNNYHKQSDGIMGGGRLLVDGCNLNPWSNWDYWHLTFDVSQGPLRIDTM